MADAEPRVMLFRYSVTLSKDITGKYVISHESLAARNAASKKEDMEGIFEVSNGEIVYVYGKEEDSVSVVNKTMNLLSTASMSSLFYDKILLPEWKKNQAIKANKTILWGGAVILLSLIHI